MKASDDLKRRQNKRRRELDKQAKAAKIQNARKTAAAKWEELTEIEKDIAIAVSKNEGKQRDLILELKDQGMTAAEIANALGDDATKIRRFFIERVK